MRTQLPFAPHLKGFTLVELLVVLAVLGLLAAMAYPSYTAHVQRAHRTDAQAILLEAAHHMQRRYAAHHRYDTGDDNAPTPSLPSSLSQSPKQGQAHYTISVSQADANTYALRATPTSTGAMTNDLCGSMILNHHHARSITGTGASLAQCWR